MDNTRQRSNRKIKMSKPLIMITGLIYLYVAMEQWYNGNNAMCLAYIGYSFSNVGLYFLAH